MDNLITASMCFVFSPVFSVVKNMPYTRNQSGQYCFYKIKFKLPS